MERVCRDGQPPIEELTEALAHDPHLAVAASDLAALEGITPARRARASLSRWERHHLEILDAAAGEMLRRAEALLRDHMTEWGCDPLALLVVVMRVDEAGAQRLDDLRRQCCACPWGKGAARR